MQTLKQKILSIHCFLLFHQSKLERPIKSTNKKQWIKIYQSFITVLSIIVAVLLETQVEKRCFRFRFCNGYLTETDTFKSTEALRKHEAMPPFSSYTFPVETVLRKRNGILNHQVSATFPNCGNTLFHPAKINLFRLACLGKTLNLQVLLDCCQNVSFFHLVLLLIRYEK